MNLPEGYVVHVEWRVFDKFEHRDYLLNGRVWASRDDAINAAVLADEDGSIMPPDVDCGIVRWRVRPVRRLPIYLRMLLPEQT